MEDLRRLMAICCGLESGPLKGVSTDERSKIISRYIDTAASHNLVLDFTLPERLSRDEQMVVCDAYYTLILDKLLAFEAFIIPVSRNPLMRIFCDPHGFYSKELYRNVDILDRLIYTPGTINESTAMGLVVFSGRLSAIKRICDKME